MAVSGAALLRLQPWRWRVFPAIYYCLLVYYYFLELNRSLLVVAGLVYLGAFSGLVGKKEASENLDESNIIKTTLASETEISVP